MRWLSSCVITDITKKNPKSQNPNPKEFMIMRLKYWNRSREIVKKRQGAVVAALEPGVSENIFWFK